MLILWTEGSNTGSKVIGNQLIQKFWLRPLILLVSVLLEARQ